MMILMNFPLYLKSTKAIQNQQVKIRIVKYLIKSQKSKHPEAAANKLSTLSANFSILNFDFNASMHAAHIQALLQKQGNMLGPMDTLIAGHARSLGYVLVTNLRNEFARVNGLMVEDWTEAAT